MDNIKHYRIRVHGKVQGVFYRANTLRVAAGLGITGWVKNESDGTVLISAQGEGKALDQLISWCEQGPEYANVNGVDYQEMELNNFDSFRIVR